MGATGKAYVGHRPHLPQWADLARQLALVGVEVERLQTELAGLAYKESTIAHSVRTQIADLQSVAVTYSKRVTDLLEEEGARG